ncbi:MAG: amidohydrolase family protein [Actinomycetota bacterium]|nr:amidohydrolase family protein [Actinomycetota bacterium]
MSEVAVIDAHLHVDLLNPAFLKRLSPDVVGSPRNMAEALGKEMAESGITQALAMGREQGTDEDPLGIRGTLEVARFVPGLHPVGVADCCRTDSAHLGRVEQELRQSRVKALKVYAGYTPAGPDNATYWPYYQLAGRYGLPVIIHTGDTPVAGAKVRFAHPLLVDEVAVEFPAVRFVMAHFGYPWLADAAEVVYKNDNVWVDLSGLLMGDRDFFEDPDRAKMLGKLAERVAEAVDYMGKPERILYGTDWPLVPMISYRDFIRRIIPEGSWPKVFQKNACELFDLAESGAPGESKPLESASGSTSP